MSFSCLPNFFSPHSTQDPFERELKLWTKNAHCSGKKKEAAERIRQVKILNQLSLNLQDLSLTSIPKEIIGTFTNLTELILRSNNLTSLPPEIGQLTNLTLLWLSWNNLTTLPAEIGRLVNVKKILLDENQLTSLPAEMGQLQSLETLIVTYNFNLSEFPLSISALTNLTHLPTFATNIPAEITRAIINQCQNNRGDQAEKALPDKLPMWQAIGKNTQDLSQIQDFTESEKMILHEWLVRLERTQDFSTCQSSLANTVCDILASVIGNDEFRATFFNQAEANNSHCEDRAAMSLNEIYLAWKILCMPERTPLKEKLTLMTGCAKTLSLRNEIGKIHSKFGESTEIYLYCEIILKKRLGLVTAIQNMTYSDFFKPKNLDLESLVKEVEKNFFDELNEIPIFEKTLTQDPEMEKKREEIEEKFQKELEEAEKSQKDVHVNAQSKQLMTELEKAKKQAAFEWYQKNSISRSLN